MQIPKPFGARGLKLISIYVMLSFWLWQPVKALQDGKQKVTIHLKNVPLDYVMKQIESQSGLRFMFSINALDVSEKITVNFNEVVLDEVLENLFRRKGIVWQYRSGVISLKKASLLKMGESNRIESERPAFSFNVGGIVQDQAGNPIPGVTVMIQGTQRGTKTNTAGKFTIDQVEIGTILLFTSIGFEKSQFKVRDDSPIMIKLVSATGILDEAVVIAYGKTTNRNIVGNISTIKAEEIQKSPVTNPLLAIQGRVTGITINQNSGYANGGVTTLIQGQNSINKGNDPFYVIDGVPYSSQMMPSFGAILGNSGNNLSNPGNSLNFINPNDIESITILKDADATAIYGSRAANGAILITTKKGKAGDMRANIGFQTGWQKLSRLVDVLDNKEYLEMRREAISNDGLTISETDYDINGFWDTTRNTNWQKELLDNTAKYTTINASISGGSNNTQYLVGGSFNKSTAPIKSDFSDQKASFHLNLSSESLNKKFSIQVSASYLSDDNKLPNADLTTYALTLAPTAPSLYNKDGSLNWAPNADGNSTFINPLSYFYQKFYSKTYNLISNTTLSYKIIDGLTVRANFGYNNLRANDIITVPLITQAPEVRPYSPRAGYYGNQNTNSWIIEPQINYVRNFGKNEFDFLLGTSFQESTRNSQQYYGIGYNSDASIVDFRSAARIVALSSYQLQYKYNALFGRVNYIHDKKYILNLSARRDGSSRFGASSRFHNFAAVGAGWVFSEEDWIKDLTSFLSFGKLRASYGTTGNDQIDDYQFLNLYTPVTVDIPYRGAIGLAPNGIPNPYLQWENTKKISAGLDVGFFKDRFLLNVTYFRNTSSNQLVSSPLPLTTGVSNITVNFPAVVRNYGWEISLNTNNLQNRNFSWSTNLNLTVPRNKLVDFPDLANSIYANSLFIGQSLSVAKVFHSLGVDPVTGVYQFTDSKGQPTFNPDYYADRTVFVDLAQKYYGGMQNTLSFKDVEFSFLIQYVKQKSQNGNSLGVSPGTYNVNQPTIVLNRWRKSGDIATHQRFNSDYTLDGSLGNASGSDLAFKDASYLRLKNISLAWKIPAGVNKKISMKEGRLFFQAQNILTLTKFENYDPETGSAFPPLRTFVLGGQFSF